MSEPTFTPPKAPTPSGITPSQSKAPPPEILKLDFNMNNAPSSSDDGRVLVEQKDGTTKPADVIPKEEVKTNELKAEPTVKEEVKTEVDKEPKKSGIFKPPVDKKAEGEVVKDKKVDSGHLVTLKDKSPRDLSGYTKEEAAVLTQMSNPAFEYTTKLIKDNKELAKRKDDTFLQHPEAYTLTPQYRESRETSRRAKVEADYWMKCLESCDKGEEFQAPAGWNNQGELVMGSNIKPTKQIEEQIRQYMINCNSVFQKENGNLTRMAQTFQQDVSASNNAIDEVRAKQFPWASDSKFLEYTVSTVQGEKSVKQIKEDTTNLFPTYMRGKLTDVIGDLMVALAISKAETTEALANQKVAEVKKEEATRGEPSSNGRPSPKGPEIGGVREFSTVGMP